MFKDISILTKDPELIELRKQYEENFGMGTMPGYHYECYASIEVYKKYVREELDRRLGIKT